MSEKLNWYEAHNLPEPSDLFDLQKYLWRHDPGNDRPRLAIVSPIKDKNGNYPILATVTHLDYFYATYENEELALNLDTKQYRWRNDDGEAVLYSCPPALDDDYIEFAEENEIDPNTTYIQEMESQFEEEVVHLYIGWSVLNLFEKIGDTQYPNKQKSYFEY